MDVRLGRRQNAGSLGISSCDLVRLYLWRGETMIHCVFDRPNGVLKVFSASGSSMKNNFGATGDAWGRVTNPNDGPHGHFWPIASGHYMLTQWQSWGVAGRVASEGYGQIYVVDLDDATKQRLIANGLCTVKGDYLVIGGVALPRGGLA